MSKPDRSVWGPPMSQYIAELPNRTSSKKEPTSFEISEAIGLLKSGYPSCETFELLLSLADRKNYLRTFLNDGLFPGCMRLFRKYCETNNARYIYVDPRYKI